MLKDHNSSCNRRICRKYTDTQTGTVYSLCVFFLKKPLPVQKKQTSLIAHYINGTSDICDIDNQMSYTAARLIC